MVNQVTTGLGRFAQKLYCLKGSLIIIEQLLKLNLNCEPPALRHCPCIIYLSTGCHVQCRRDNITLKTILKETPLQQYVNFINFVYFLETNQANPKPAQGAVVQQSFLATLRKIMCMLYRKSHLVNEIGLPSNLNER